MADEGNVTSALDLGAAGNGEDSQPQVGIISQYVKDLSVENPNAPASFRWQDPPQVDIQFNIAAKAVEGNEVHEIELKLTVTAKGEAGVAYAVELTYCGLIAMRNLDEGQRHAYSYAEAPRLLFPFARRILADAVRDAGYAPMMLDPIDFNGLYFQQMAQRGGFEGAAVGNA